ncbi:MAG: uncharacterized membrane protein (UPF0127 family) [Cryomorphaceae bacterium]|jgi:uncharacterized membrane protein (UPF0127 family)
MIFGVIKQHRRLGNGVRIACLTLALLTTGASCVAAQTIDCEIDNAALRVMPKSLVTFTRQDGSQFAVEVKTAKNSRSRAAGFQRVCESTVEQEPMLFLFDREFMPKFHMNNVVAPLAIAFFTKKGVIKSIQTMQPYVVASLKKPLYGPSVPVLGALEGHIDFFGKHKLNTKSTMRWQALSVSK